jgi:hypothetical protein
MAGVDVVPAQPEELGSAGAGHRCEYEEGVELGVVGGDTTKQHL